jgi:hypothetical protein
MYPRPSIAERSSFRTRVCRVVGVLARAGVAGVAFLATAVASAHAQSGPLPEPGDRVRISSPRVSGEFLLTELRPDSFFVRGETSSDEIRIPTASMFDLEVYQGTRSRLGTAALGGLGGALFGGLLAVPCYVLTHLECGGVTPGERVLIGAGVGALFGTLRWGGREVWAEVRLPGGPAPVAPGGSLADRPAEGGVGREVITREQIAALSTRDAYAIIGSLEPGWLRGRRGNTLGGAAGSGADGSSGGGGVEYPVVFLDGVRYGELASLRRLRSEEVEQMELMSPFEASTRYGSGYVAGIILVTTRR